MNTIAEKGVWVLVEQQDGKPGDGSLELVAEAARLAEKMRAEVIAVVPGSLPPDQVTLLAQHGARKVVLVEHAALAKEPSPETAAHVLADLIRRHNPAIVLAVNTVAGADLAARIAAQLNAGLVTGCDRVDVDSAGRLTATRPVYAGKAAAQCTSITPQPQMATVNPDAIELKAPNPKNTAETVTITIESTPPAAHLRKVGFVKGDPKSIQLTEADIVVCAGMGISAKANLRLVEELADAIGGSVAATRRVVDEGWMGLPRQVGLTGKTVRPRLYIACGVSGAIQHTMGMKDSRAIIAVNTDRNAPIFKIADVAILGDVMKVLPVLTAHLKKTLAQIPKPTVGDVLDAAAKVKPQ